MRFRTLSEIQQLWLVVCALGLLFLAVTLSGFYATFTATNAVEHQRSMLLAEGSIKAQKLEMMSHAEDNAWWNEASIRIYGDEDEKSLFKSYWADYSQNNDDDVNHNFYIVALLDEKFNVISATKEGENFPHQISDQYDDSLFHTLSKLSLDHPSVSMIINHHKELYIASASVIRHDSRALNEKMIGNKIRIIMFLRKFSNKAIEGIARNYNMPGLKLEMTDTQKEGFALKDESGKVLGHLTWNAPTTGKAAVTDSLPVLLVAGLMFFIALHWAAKMGVKLINSVASQARTDSLSGLLNRRALHAAIQLEHSTGNIHALALIDLDGFKHVNDSFGHAVGDQLIVQVSAMLQTLATDGVVVARLGGDEFAVLISGSDAKRRIERFALRFLQNFVEPIMIEHHCTVTSASIGLASTSKEEPLSEKGELLRRADIAMYQAKRLGKMQVRWYDNVLEDGQSEATAIAAELRAALINDELSVVYQPIVEVHSNRPTALEAFVRWNSPTRGPIPPSIFLPIAESSGIIDAVGSFVLRRACMDITHWHSISLAVNISAAQLKNPNFPQHLISILDETGFDPKRLQLEITEANLIADATLAKKAIADVSAFGVTVSLDDFGTGYASIGFLRQFPFTRLKIDRSLVKEAQYSEEARMLIQVSIAAARALRMKVTAEGVETEAEAALMQAAGCDQLQGWHFGRPVENSGLLAMLTQEAAYAA